MNKNDGLLIQLNYGIYFYHRKEDFTAKTPRSNVKFENYWKTIIKFGHVKCHILFHWNIIEKCVKTDIKSKCKWNRCGATFTAVLYFSFICFIWTSAFEVYFFRILQVFLFMILFKFPWKDTIFCRLNWIRFIAYRQHRNSQVAEKVLNLSFVSQSNVVLINRQHFPIE